MGIKKMWVQKDQLRSLCSRRFVEALMTQDKGHILQKIFKK